MAFFAKISDPKIGGTNMTLLTTVSHLGIKGSVTIALWLHDLLTFKKCSVSNIQPCFNKTGTNSKNNNNFILHILNFFLLLLGFQYDR